MSHDMGITRSGWIDLSCKNSSGKYNVLFAYPRPIIRIIKSEELYSIEQLKYDFLLGQNVLVHGDEPYVQGKWIMQHCLKNQEYEYAMRILCFFSPKLRKEVYRKNKMKEKAIETAIREEFLHEEF